MFRQPRVLAALLAALLAPAGAHAGVWLELLHAPCWTGSAANLVQDDGVYGEFVGAVDCFNKDFNGGGARTTLSIKAFQPWEYGWVFLYYDITGPFNSAIADVLSPNEKGGFFGGLTVAVSLRRVGEKVLGTKLGLGPLVDVSLKGEVEHVARIGALFYYGLVWELAVPFFGVVAVSTLVRDDPAFEGVDLQVGVVWEAPFLIAGQGFLFAGFFQAGLFGEGKGRGAFATTSGRPYLLTQPQLLWDAGRVLRFAPQRLYLGVEYQVALNRYLIPGKTENVLQAMVRWNI
ncbi:MAG: hypothetical protein L0Y66_04945 [Myxococcaceae bacterium]|nr:hypothetical protein [Myxococcaceae bacterium]MCI0670241.1 hypothetical protein [Myxococcaceae bacterium]